MRIIANLIFATAIGIGLVVGCATSQQTIVFNSLYTVEHTTVAAYDGYVGQVVAGHVPTNGVPRVSKAFNHFQASFLVALDAAQFNTNALAPANLIIESQDVVNLIAQLSTPKPSTVP